MKRILSILLCLCMVFSCMGAVSFASGGTESLNIISAFADYHVCGEYLSDDGYIGIPVEVNTYIKGETNEKTRIVLYVINTNTKRIGTEEDEPIISDLLDEGYVVVVLDYKNNAKSVSPDLDWSIQKIRTDIENGAYLNGASHEKYCTYVLPAGYRLQRSIKYWNFEENGADGCLDYIVEIWNSDFKKAKGGKKITYPDGTVKKVSEVTANSIDDCVKPDGSPIDLNLYLDIVYPSNPKEEVPVMCLASSAETSVDSWSDPKRPHLTGFLFAGYAGVVYDHCYVPMSRNDHYGYFDGTDHDAPFTLYKYTGTKSETAAIRCLRYLADAYPDKYKFKKDKFGGYGHSKGSHVFMLGNTAPEKCEEYRYFSGHHGECAEGVTQPYLTYKDGSKIPSNIQMVYSSNGGGTDYICENFAPLYVSAGEADGTGMSGFVKGHVSAARQYDIPSMYMTMPGVGHTIIYGYSEKYQIDMYNSLFDFAHYYLKDAKPVCEYILPLNGTKDFDTNGEITLKFTGPIARSEIESKVKIINKKTGKAALGTWESEFKNTTWKFTGHDLTGGCEYEISVPESVTADNGKTLREAKSFTFKTKYEQGIAAKDISSDNADMTLLKTADTDNGVYLLFDSADYENSTTTDLRFSVINDAANRVSVYALDDIDEENIQNSLQGSLLADIGIAGKGDYSADITEYVKSLKKGEKAGFLLKAKDVKETKTITDLDFETVDSRFNAGAYSTDQNNTPGGLKSYKSTSEFSIRRLIFNPSITEADFGRKFNISMDVYPTANRYFTLRVRNYSSAALNWPDYNDTTVNKRLLEKDTWHTLTTTYQVNDLYYCAPEILKDGISISSSGTGEAYYIDNLKVTEDITEVKIAKEQTNESFAPSIVLHPANKITDTPIDASYVESGERENESFENEESMAVSGREKEYRLSQYKKVYAKVDLSGFDGANKANVSINVKNNNSGDVYVYGIADPAAALYWNNKTLNYLNAPANDRFGFGIDVSKAYASAPIGTISVGGSGNYSIDITEYALNMKAQGAAQGVLVFAFASQPREEKQLSFTDFNDEKVPFTVIKGGDIISHGLSKAENHGDGAGFSYAMNTAYNYDRLKFDLLRVSKLSDADIGRSFSITYYLKSDKTGMFMNSLLHQSGANEHVNKVMQNYTTANEWQKFTYEFSITEDMIAPGQETSTIPAYLNFQLSSMGNRANGGSDKVLAYIDDFTVTEKKVGDIEFEINEGDVNGGLFTKQIAFDDLESWRGPGPGTEVNSNYDMILGGGTVANLKMQLVGSDVTADHTTGDGKSLWLCMPNSYNRFKFYNFFDHNLTSGDVGRKFKISFWAKGDKAGKIDCGFMSHGSASSYTTKIYEGTYSKKQTYSITTEWQKYTYDAVVEEAMLASYYTGHEKDAYNPALFSIVSSGMSGRNLYVDDIEIEEIDRNFKYDGDFEKADATIGNYAFGQGFENGSERITLSTEDNHSENGSRSIKIINNKSYNRLFFNGVVPVLTTDDVGDTYNVSFYLKSSKAGSFLTTVTNSSAGTSGNSRYDGQFLQRITIAADDVGKWVKYNVKFTVADHMVENSAKHFAMYFDSLGTEGTPATLYFDDFQTRKTVNVYSYSNDIEKASKPSDVITWGGISNAGVNIVLSDENHTAGGAKSIKVYSEQNYNRVFLLNAIKAPTAEDIGKRYKISLWLMSSKAGAFELGLANSGTNFIAYDGQPRTKYTIASGEVNTWKRYSFDVTIDDAMVENNARYLGVYMSSFGQSSSPADIYIDDIISVEYPAGAAVDVGVSDACAVNSTGKSSVLQLDRYDAAAKIRKSYLHFTGGEYENTQKALLNFEVCAAFGQTVKIYALKDAVFPSSLTYKDAPAYAKDETIDLDYAYGAKPIASFAAEPKAYSVDVTDYVKYTAPDEYTFVFVCEQTGGKEYYNLDLSKYSLTKDVDYKAEKDVTVSNGGAAVSGGKIKLLNIFGSGNEIIKAGETYKVTADITPVSDAEIVLGFDSENSDEIASQCTSINASANVSSNIEFEYTATEEDKQNGICAISIYANSETDGGFVIENVSVQSENPVVISKSAELVIETAKEIDVPDERAQAQISVMSNKNNVVVNGEDKGTSYTAAHYVGERLNLSLADSEGFMYWKDASNGFILSYDPEYSLNVGSDRSIIAIFAEDGVYVSFKNINGQVVAEGLVNGELRVPQNPYVYGYEFAGWFDGKEKSLLKAGDIVSADKNTVYNAGYSKKADLYKVDVNGSEKSYKYNDLVSVTAEGEKDGKAFSYWERNGKIVCYDLTYSFYVSADSTVNAVYGQSSADKNVLVMANPCAVGGDKIAFFAERNIADEYTVIESGILLGQKEGLNLTNAKIKAVSKNVSNKGQFTIRKKSVGAGEKWYGVSYVIYADESGNIKTIYSNEVNMTL